jgi:asparagine synthase (glutamine-hydrolysing)
MCGINGIVHTRSSGRRVVRRSLLDMRDVLIHRGPDEAGVHLDDNVGLGHRRLSIIDLASGQQPMYTPDRSRVIIYNGEIYNHQDRRKELIEMGYEFSTNCDTETILHLYQEYGEACVHKLRGMFAFAIWDEQEQKLFIGRDRLGVKPLYYLLDEQGSLYFASEIKSILRAGSVKPDLNYTALPDHLANHGTSGEETLFRNIKRLPPGHVLVWKNGTVRVEEYWDISFEPKHQGEDAELVSAWLDLFKRSVEMRLMSDVPLGMFLSGGIDSSAICAVMSQMVDEPIKTFSVGFDESSANEFEYARLVADAYGTDHRETVIKPDDFFEALPRMIWHEDEPLAFPASIPLYFVSKLASKHVKVVLTGEGSDEILAGYGRYRNAIQLIRLGRTYESVAPGFVRSAVKAGVATLPGSLGGKLNRTFLSKNADIQGLFLDSFSVFGSERQRGLLTSRSKAKIGDVNPYAHHGDLLSRMDAESLLDRLLYVDSKTYLHELLMKQDQMSMAASIESRVPFLDHELVEFTAGLPQRFKLRGSTTKWTLRQAMRGILPGAILERPKMGFPVPIGQWFRGSFRNLIDEFVLSETAMDRGVFEPSFVRALVKQHNLGENHDERLWYLLNFEIWNRIFMDGEQPEELLADCRI